MGDLHDGERVVVDAEGEGILGEFTFAGEDFAEHGDGEQSGDDKLVGAATPADASADTADGGDMPSLA